MTLLEALTAWVGCEAAEAQEGVDFLLANVSVDAAKAFTRTIEGNMPGTPQYRAKKKAAMAKLRIARGLS